MQDICKVMTTRATVCCTLCASRSPSPFPPPILRFVLIFNSQAALLCWVSECCSAYPIIRPSAFCPGQPSQSLIVAKSHQFAKSSGPSLSSSPILPVVTCSVSPPPRRRHHGSINHLHEGPCAQHSCPYLTHSRNPRGTHHVGERDTPRPHPEPRGSAPRLLALPPRFHRRR
jgi:hypothetical protein